MLQVYIYSFLSVVFLALSGWFGYLAREKHKEVKDYKSYSFSYFDVDNKNIESDRKFLNELDHAKRRAFDQLEKELDGDLDFQRLSTVNDYVFRFYKDFRNVQKDWFKKNGRYFQGLKTMPNPPDYKKNSKIEITRSLSDQVEHWKDVGYNEVYAPVQITCDVYEGPNGHGFIVSASVKVKNYLCKNFMHIGREDRGIENFVWVNSNLEAININSSPL